MTRFVVVTDTPSAYNAGEGRLLAKSAAKLLGASMAAAGFAREDFTMFPQSRCPYNKDEFTTKEQKAIRDHCRGYLDDFLKASAPEAIIPLGAEPARQVLGRAVKITKVRGVIEHSQEYGTKVFPMLNPGMVLMYPQHRVTFDMDCIALLDLAEVSYRLKVRARRMLGDYEFIDDLQFLIDAEPDILFYDTETTGLSFFAPGTHDVRDYDPSVHGKEFAPRPAVLTLQFAIEPEKSYMLVWDHPENPVPLRRKRRLLEQLRLLLNNPKTRVVGQNAKYDRVFTESCLGVSYPIGGDTLMLATLLDENAISKGQDMLVRQYVPAMAGYADCVDPDTLLLMEDLTKKRAGDIQPSDRLIGFQEYAVNGTSRKMVPTVVESVRRLRMPSYVICMMDGRRIQVSGNHQFLRGRLCEQFGGGWKWVTADSLRVGDLLKLFPFPEEERTFDAGWMAGILDGEGYITGQGNAGMRLGFCQLEGPVLEEGMRLFNKGENLQISWDKRKRLANVTVSGYRAMSELIRLRPRRLLAKKPWEGKALFVGEGSQGRIKSIEYVGRRDVMSIQTSSRTFIANGFATHNCFNATYDKSRMWEIPLSELISYGCGDTDSGYRLHTVLYDMVRKDRKLLAHYVRVTLPGLNAFAAIEQRGMYVDEEALDVFESVVAQDVEERYQSLISQVPRSIKRAHVEKGLKFSRGDFIRDILFYHKDGFRLTPKVFTQTTAKLPPDKRVASTSSKNHLPYFYDTHPFTYELTEYIQSERLLGTNIRGFKKKYIVDGLVRPTYSLWTAVTGRSACVRADTPVVTSCGLVRADAIRVGDMVFTHAYRWKPVTALFRKDPALMYDVYLSNGGVLSVTAHHRVMLDSGLWADIGYILEGLGYVISQQATDAEPTVSTSCSDDVYTGRSIQYAEGYEIPTVKTSGENSAVQEAAGFRLHGWAGVPNPPRDVSVASGYTRQVLDPRRGVTIEKVVCAGVHRVYDFEVADDHSYLACGVFNHNSENPNGQNIPKRGKLAKAYRRSFVAPRGYLVIEADLSQAELRIAASMANEATMLSVYRNAGDIHTETALIALGITRAKFKELPKAEQKSARQKAKAVNFGFIYGMGWRKFIGYAKTQYGVEFTDEEAQRIRTAFFKKYSGLSSWHERQRQAAMRDGQVRSYSGRIRHLPMIYSDDEMVQQEAGRQSINSPVQEFASSLGVMAIGRLSAEIDPQYLAPIAFVHDAIFCYVKEEYLEWGAKTLKWYMESNPLEEWFGLRMPCPIVADVSFGENFGDTFEMEGLVLDQPYDFTRFKTSDDGGPNIYVPEQYDPPNYGLLAEIDK